MKIKCVILALLCFLRIDAQMIYTLQTSSNSYFYNIYPEPGTENYFLVNMNWNYGQTSEITKCQILKISPAGALLDSLNFNPGFNIGASWIAVGNFYYCYGTQIKDYPGNGQSFFSTLFKIDQNLSIVKQVIIDTSYNDRILFNYVVCKNSHLYISNSRLSTNTSFFYKTDMNLVKIDSSLQTGTLSDLSAYGDKLLASGQGLAQGSAFGNSQVMELDTAFAVLSRFNLDSLTLVNAGCTQTVGISGFIANLHVISPRKYAVIGWTGVVNSATCSITYQNVAAVIKDNSHVLSSQIIGDPAKNNIISVKRIPESMRYNYIYTTAETGYDMSNFNPPPQTNTTQILVYKIDTTGALAWSRYYSDPGFYYIPYNVLATADSGAVICGMRYNTVNPLVPQVCEGFVMRINKDGAPQYVGIKENGQLDMNYHKCYPNPVSDKLYFDLPLQDYATLSIYDVLGKQLLRCNNYQSLSSIDVSGLSTGVYTYRIKTGQKNYSGKFIKE